MTTQKQTAVSEPQIVTNERKCPTCGCYMANAEEDVNGEVESEYQCNNENCKSNKF